VSIETVLLVPVIFVIALLAVQAAIVMHGISVANHVAAQGAITAARHGSNNEYGAAAVLVAAGSLGARLASPPEFAATTDHVAVTVAIAVPRTVPFFAERVSRRVTVPRERYIPYGER
jgi:predicted HD phosphohydrolase